MVKKQVPKNNKGKFFRYSFLRKKFNVPDIVTFEDLINILPASINKKRITKAYEYAKVIHSGQYRGTGEPFIHHPLAVAYLVAKLELDKDAIVAALLHDTVEDNNIGVEVKDIKQHFGADVAFLVDSLTHIKRVTNKFLGHNESIPDLRKLLIAAVDDVRVLILRLSDKVHNAWTISGVPQEKQIRFAKRALTLYAPLAHFVALTAYRRELEEVAFSILHPQIFDWLRTRMAYLYDVNMDVVIDKIKASLKKENFNYEITGRRKSLWSVYTKLKRYLTQEGIYERVSQWPIEQQLIVMDKTLNELPDLVGVLILADKEADLYQMSRILQSVFNTRLEHIEDYIKNPKPNGYRGLHIVVQMPIKLPNKQEIVVPVEIQLKTKEMHEYNEYGPASYILYKWGEVNTVAFERKETFNNYNWLRKLVSWNPKKKNFKLRLFEDSVFVLTPQGQIIKMPKGATPVDLLYKLNKKLLFDLVGVLINGKKVAFSHKLKTGDIVSFIIDPLGHTMNKELLKGATSSIVTNYIKAKKNKF